MSIEEKVEQFVDWADVIYKHAHKGEDVDSFLEDFYDILRSFVEECCEQLYEVMPSGQKFDRDIKVAEKNIRRHFAWLAAKPGPDGEK